jgi:hypothetical protein
MTRPLILLRSGSRRRAVAAALAAIPVFVLAGCGATTSSGQPPAHPAKPAASSPARSALAGLPAGKVLARALAAASAAGSVHFAGTDASASGSANTYSQNASSDAGTQVITSSGGGTLSIRAVAGVGYFQGNVASLAQLFPGKPVSRFAGRWIVTRPGDPGYQDITAGMTLASALAQFTPAGTLTLSARQTVGGKTVIGVKGVAPANIGVPQGQPAVLYVMATGQPFPVSFRAGAGASREIVVFSDWGETVDAAAPARAVAITSVEAS